MQETVKTTDTKLEMWTIIFAFSLMPTTATSGDCFTSTSSDGERCEIQGRYRADSLRDCCRNATSSGFTSQDAWVSFEDEGFFGKHQVHCTLCRQYLTQSRFRCFASVSASNPRGQPECHRDSLNSTWWVRNESDCCRLRNSSGFSRDPYWRWSKELGSWYTHCAPCDKEGYVVCYEGYEQGHVCGKPQPLYAGTATECCSRRQVKAFAYLGQDHRPISCLPCPIDGGWAEWSPWSPCSGSCGQGLRTRARECNRPDPQHGGKSCPESNAQSQICSLAPCPEWGPWSAFAMCSATCGTGLAVRRRFCQGTGCVGHRDTETAECQGPPCRPFQQQGTITLENGEWGPWSDCDSACGPGLRTRKRTCPSDRIGAGCSGAEGVQTEACTGKDCSDIHIGQIVAWTVAAVAFLALLVVLTVICKRKRIARKYYYQVLPVRFRKKADVPVPKTKEKKRAQEPLPAVEISRHVGGGKTPPDEHNSRIPLSAVVTVSGKRRAEDATDAQGYEIPSPLRSPRYANLRASWSSLSPEEAHIYEELHSGIAVAIVPGKQDQSAQTEL